MPKFFSCSIKFVCESESNAFKKSINVKAVLFLFSSVMLFVISSTLMTGELFDIQLCEHQILNYLSYSVKYFVSNDSFHNCTREIHIKRIGQLLFTTKYVPFLL